MIRAETHRPIWPVFTLLSGLLLMWLCGGAEFVAWWSLAFFVFFVGPLWLGHVFGKPCAKSPRAAAQPPRSSA